MTTNETRTQKNIAQEYCHDAWCVGIDANGAGHYWSQYFETVVVVDGTDADVFELAETPCGKLGDWRDHVANKRGWSDCRIGGSIIDDAAAVAEAVK